MTTRAVQPLGRAKSNLDENQKHYFYFTPTDCQRKITTKIHKNPGEQAKLKYTDIKKDQRATRHVLDMGTQ